jgi:hypothetical protein
MKLGISPVPPQLQGQEVPNSSGFPQFAKSNSNWLREKGVYMFDLIKFPQLSDWGKKLISPSSSVPPLPLGVGGTVEWGNRPPFLRDRLKTSTPCGSRVRVVTRPITEAAND